MPLRALLRVLEKGMRKTQANCRVRNGIGHDTERGSYAGGNRGVEDAGVTTRRPDENQSA